MRRVDFPAEEEFLSSSPEETARIGEETGRRLQPGSVVALGGNLGAGKTVFAKGIAKALGVREEVTSPTYTIISEYEGICPFYHMDAYRLGGDEEFALLGGEEPLYGRGICVIEWAERLRSLPEDTLRVEITILEGGKRRIRRLAGTGSPREGGA
ncbi:MAG: tRNA (adenosine(37)-N6)-threonylcarbamoyltransferase complex ATPase subunit type 1 TsaE [Treponema sp.]|jgi:tRNA threonylcarbamoyladenosine biosynthesis protein TsaE|nr:tRNA (adenosine(37)-N6)-threonylcarbamoyltransferase complex ATPase subunit type 1 TsaE [Treponema sp.]